MKGTSMFQYPRCNSERIESESHGQHRVVRDLCDATQKELKGSHEARGARDHASTDATQKELKDR